MTFSRVVALSGGVGGARFLDGVARALPPGALTAVVNTGDDFVHWGLYVSPDVDTVIYTLAGLADETRGWGLTGETFHDVRELKKILKGYLSRKHRTSYFGPRDAAQAATAAVLASVTKTCRGPRS